MSVGMTGDFGDGIVRHLNHVPEEWLELPEKERNKLILKRIFDIESQKEEFQRRRKNGIRRS